MVWQTLYKFCPRLRQWGPITVFGKPVMRTHLMAGTDPHKSGTHTTSTPPSHTLSQAAHPTPQIPPQPKHRHISHFSPVPPGLVKPKHILSPPTHPARAIHMSHTLPTLLTTLISNLSHALDKTPEQKQRDQKTNSRSSNCLFMSHMQISSQFRKPNSPLKPKHPKYITSQQCAPIGCSRQKVGCCCLPTPMTLASGGVRCSHLWSTSQFFRPYGQQCSHSGGVCPQIQG